MGMYWMREQPSSVGTPAQSVDIRARLVEMCVVDAAGKPIFGPGELRERSGSVIDKLFTVAQRLSGMGGDKTVADLGKV